jgi:hypothetical protein
LDLEENNTIGADGQVKSAVKSRVSVSKLGENKFNNTELVLLDLSHINTAYNSNIDGILGYPILSQQKVILSYSKEELIFLNKF